MRHGGAAASFVDVSRTTPLDKLLAARRRPDSLAPRARQAELVKLRFFAGLSNPEAAAALGISVATAERWWAFARTSLYADLADAAPEKSPGG